jgi:hypothetical protein
MEEKLTEEPKLKFLKVIRKTNCMLADNILSFIQSLSFTETLPNGIECMNPYQDAETMKLAKQFYKKFYNDTNPRYAVLGINPGRLGSGTTGIPFTDPKRLISDCGIQHSFDPKTELSSDFIYRMIEAFGGVKLFYQKFFLSAVCPLGFTMEGKNINYYDSPELKQATYDFIITTLQQQINLGISREVCFCLGEGKNLKELQKLNDEHQFFKTLIALPHPRFIMQYKRTQIGDYINQYVTNFKNLPANDAA